MIVETRRLRLRKMTQDDYSNIAKILQDEEVMYAYEGAFDDAFVQIWLDKQIERYQVDGVGLWIVERKEDGICIGQCGLTKQYLNEKEYLEVGYLFAKEYWYQGYATEAAIACKSYAFQTLQAPVVYSIIRSNNQPSIRVAKRNNMHCVDHYLKHYRDVDMMHDIYMVENDSESTH